MINEKIKVLVIKCPCGKNARFLGVITKDGFSKQTKKDIAELISMGFEANTLPLEETRQFGMCFYDHDNFCVPKGDTSLQINSETQNKIEP